ncbi:MAG: hypothetical protein LBG49_01405 [Mycoplasmataceae bacterium]|nr:hypothetical protein [Mycoplasmataceae bacterium]
MALFIYNNYIWIVILPPPTKNKKIFWKIFAPTILIGASVITASVVLTSCNKNKDKPEKAEFAANDSVDDIINNPLWKQYVDTTTTHIFKEDARSYRSSPTYLHFSDEFFSWKNAVNTNEGMMIYILKYFEPEAVGGWGYGEFKCDFSIKDTTQELNVNIFGKKQNSSWTRLLSWDAKASVDKWELTTHTTIPESEDYNDLTKTFIITKNTNITNAGSFDYDEFKDIYGSKLDFGEDELIDNNFYNFFFIKQQFPNMQWIDHDPYPLRPTPLSSIITVTNLGDLNTAPFIANNEEAIKLTILAAIYAKNTSITSGSLDNKIDIWTSDGESYATIQGKDPWYSGSVTVTFSFEGQQALSDVITVTDLGQFVWSEFSANPDVYIFDKICTENEINPTDLTNKIWFHYDTYNLFSDVTINGLAPWYSGSVTVTFSFEGQQDLEEVITTTTLGAISGPLTDENFKSKILAQICIANENLNIDDLDGKVYVQYPQEYYEDGQIIWKSYIRGNAPHYYNAVWVDFTVSL